MVLYGTIYTCAYKVMLHLLGILTDYGKHVMFIGDDGVGKSTIMHERIRQVCSGEVAEVLKLTIQTNRFMINRVICIILVQLF